MTKGKKIRIMVFGTFDVIHPGHEHFFAQARALANRPYLIVSVARDANAERVKGEKPRRSERARLAAIKKLSKKTKLVNKVVLGGLRNHIPHILKQRPNIIALGHDQKEYTNGLKSALAARGLKVKIVRLKAHQRHRYRSSLLLKKN